MFSSANGAKDALPSEGMCVIVQSLALKHGWGRNIHICAYCTRALRILLCLLAMIESSNICRPNIKFSFHLSPDVPSGCELQQLLADIEEANTEVGDLTGYWKDLLNASLETARKFEADQR